MRFLRRSLLGFFLLSMALALLAAGGSVFYGAVQERMAREGFDRPARERQFAVTVVNVTPGAIRPVLQTFGEIHARQSLELRLPTGGRIVEVSANFEEGGRVEAGEILVRVDPSDAAAALRVAEVALAEAIAEQREAERALVLAGDDLDEALAQLALRTSALDRQKDLSARGVGTESAIEAAELAAAAARQAILSKRQSLANSEARVDQAQTGVLRAEIARDNAQRDVDDTVLTAAFSGVLSGVTALRGGIVNGNEKLGSLVAPDALEVSFYISTRAYGRLAAGADGVVGLPVTVSLDVDEFDLSARGVLTRENVAVDAGQTGRQLFASLEDAAGLRAGDFVEVTLSEPELQGVALLPAAAVGAAQSVLVVSEEERLEEVPVTVLRRQGREVLVSAEGLADKRIVAARSPVLGAGIKVQIVNDDAEAPETATKSPGQKNASAATSGPATGKGSADEMVALTEEKRAALLAFVKSNDRMPEEARARIEAQLNAEKVPADLVARLEARMGS